MEIWSLGLEDTLEECMATTAVFLPEESHGQGGWRATGHGFTQSRTQLKQLSTHTHRQILGSFSINLPFCLSSIFLSFSYIISSMILILICILVSLYIWAQWNIKFYLILFIIYLKFYYKNISSCTLLPIIYYYFLINTIYACVHAKSLQSCPTLCDPVDCSLSGCSVHGILQARILKCFPCPSPWACVIYCIADTIHSASHLFTPSALFTESRVHEAGAKRQEEDMRSHRNWRHIYSLLTGTTDIIQPLSCLTQEPY